eukprot:gene6627-334_t
MNVHYSDLKERPLFPSQPEAAQDFDVFVEFLCTLLQDPSQDESVLSAGACVLVNLLAQNQHWQVWIRRRSQARQFYRSLVSYLSNPDLLLVVATLNLVSRLLLDDDELGQKLFNDENIEQIFELTFSLLTSPANSSQQCIVHLYTVELFSVLMESVRCVTALGSFTKLAHFLDLIIASLNSDVSHTIGINVRFLRVVCSVPQCVDLLIDRLSKVSLCIFEGEELLDTILAWLAADHSYNLPYSLKDDITELIVRLIVRLTKGQSPMLLKISSFVSSMYNSTIASGKGQSGIDLILASNLSRIASVINDHSPKHHLILLGASQLHEMRNLCMDTGCQLVFPPSKNTGTTFTVFKCAEETRTLITFFSEYIISVLATELGDHEEIYHCLSDILHADEFLVFLIQNLGSPNPHLVESTTRILCSQQFRSICSSKRLASVVATWNHTHPPNKEQRSFQTQPTSHIVYHPNGTTHTHKNDHSGDTVTQSIDPKIDEDIQKVMRHVKQSLHLRDLRASEIMSIYEGKLRDAITKEQRLSSLLDAKTQALLQSDRLVADYRTQQTMLDDECSKLRAMLRESEGRREAFQLELTQQQHVITSLQQERTRIQNEIEDFMTLQRVHEDVCDQWNTLKITYKSLQTEHDELKSYVSHLKGQQKDSNDHLRQLKMQNHQLEEQVVDLTRALDAETENSTTKTKQLQDFQTEYQSLSSQFSAQQGNINSLEAKLATCDEELTKSKEKNLEKDNTITRLEHLNKELKESLNTMEDKLAKIQEELEKHQQITTMIHSIMYLV